ncbi:tetratricopeptide repeat protein [bacterium]|nr:tetratricopeptide repeat protein [candidate division CSSED10-310 bacterium]
MTFTGKPGDLATAEILGIIHASQTPKILKISSADRTYFLRSDNCRIVAIGNDRSDEQLRQVFKDRGMMLPATGLLSEQVADAEPGTPMALAGYHLAEALFFQFLELKDGRFEWLDASPSSLFKFDDTVSRWIEICQPDVQFMTQFRIQFPDFDKLHHWVHSDDGNLTVEDLTLDEIRIIAENRQDLTVRKELSTHAVSLKSVSEVLLRLKQSYFLTEDTSDSPEPSSSLLFMQTLLGNAVDRLMEVNTLLGRDRELMDILQAINEKLDSVNFSKPPVSFSPDELGDLVNLTGSLEGLLDLNGVEELNLQQEMESTHRKPLVSMSSTPKPSEDRQPEKKNVKAGVKRQPIATGSAEIVDLYGMLDSNKSKREMQPDKKREDEAVRIIQESVKYDRDNASMEEKVESKVRYRRFGSNVTMAYNRYVMTNQTLFEMFGLAPNADKKAIHKAFVKSIEMINPKGIRFRILDQPILEKAVYLRDVYKGAYVILMDDDKKRRYLAGMRKGRQLAEENKTQAMRLFNTGMEKIRSGKFEEARAIFAQAAKLDPNSPVYYSVLEDIDKEEREGNAVKFFQAGILAFKQKNDYERAIQLIRKAVSLRPLDPTYHLKLAEIQLLSGKYKEDAVVTYQHALDLDPGNQDLRLTIANLVKNLGRKQEAANMYQDMLKWNPDNTVVKKFLLELQKEGIKPVQDEASKSKEKKDTVVNEEFE